MHEGKYCEVHEWQPTKTGRGSQSYGVKYEELDTGKPGTTKFASTAKVTKVDPDRSSCEVMYVNHEEKKVMVADEDYNEVEVPISNFPSQADFSEGARLTLWTDEEIIVKVVMQPRAKT